EVSWLFAAGLRNDPLRDVGGDLRVGVEHHRVVSPTLGTAAQVTHVAKHFRQRNECLDDTGPGAFLHGLDLTAPAVQVTDHVAHVLFRRGDLNRHDRLEENRVGFTGRLLEGHGTGDLEGELRGVHVVVGPVLEGHLDADQRVSSEDTELGGLLATSVYRRDVLPRDTTASDVVDELVARAVTVTVDRKRFEVDDHATVLAGATRLLLVGVLDAFDLAANRLAVGHLGLTDVGLDLE